MIHEFGSEKICWSNSSILVIQMKRKHTVGYSTISNKASDKSMPKGKVKN